MTDNEIYELGKKEVDYDRQLSVCGKEKADNVLFFWIKGYKYAAQFGAKPLWSTCVDCGVQNETVYNRGVFNGFQCDKCKRNQDIEDEDCR